MITEHTSNNLEQTFMPLKFKTILLHVEDVPRTRFFHETVLMQQVIEDREDAITFTSGVSLASRQPGCFHSRESAETELVFECDDFDGMLIGLVEHGYRNIHEQVMSDDSGKESVAIIDPAGNRIVIRETFQHFVWRLHFDGLALDEIELKTRVPRSILISNLRHHGIVT